MWQTRCVAKQVRVFGIPVLFVMAGLALVAACSSSESTATSVIEGEVATTAPLTASANAPVDGDVADGAGEVSDGVVAPAVDGSPAATPFAVTAGATVIDLDDEAPGLWTVDGAVDGLNVRANPGSSSRFLGVYAPGQEGIATTGKRVELNGVEWKQVNYGDGDAVGWVAALYLQPAANSGADNNAAAPVPVRTDRRECYAGGPAGSGYVALFDFNDDGTAFTGALRVDIGGAVSYTAVAASKVPPSPFTVRVRPVGGTERVEQWVFGVDGVEFPGVAIDLTSCTEIAPLIAEIDQQVTSYPAAP